MSIYITPSSKLHLYSVLFYLFLHPRLEPIPSISPRCLDLFHKLPHHNTLTNTTIYRPPATPPCCGRIYTAYLEQKNQRGERRSLRHETKGQFEGARLPPPYLIKTRSCTNTHTSLSSPKNGLAISCDVVAFR